MPFFRRPKPASGSSSSQPAETREELLRRRVRESIRVLQNTFPNEYERVLSAVENGDTAQATRVLRGLGSIVDEGHIQPFLKEMQNQVTAARLSYQNALDENPNALRILLRSGNRSEAIEFYQRRTGVDWPEALAAIKELEQQLAADDAKGTQ